MLCFIFSLFGVCVDFVSNKFASSAWVRISKKKQILVLLKKDMYPACLLWVPIYADDD